MAQTMRNTICLNKSDNKKRTSRSFSILFSVIESLEITLLKDILHFCSALSKSKRKD